MGSNEAMQKYQTWMCLICGWIYDESAGLPEENIAPGTRWADIPMNWAAPNVALAKTILKWR